MVKAFKSEAALTDAERKGRVDIKYRSAAGKHIIIELKKYARAVSIDELIRQVGKYKNAALKVLQAANPDVTDHQLEIICILGAAPTPETNLSDHRQALARLQGAVDNL